ncbi:MAG: DNA-directed RNA polymerase subunit alpha [Gemmatimonadetes bacterium]|nr:DNA-directed RNA polymerase subunit alpha [Gemmatimonadota bacterium]MYG15283.1 DNA-directed RNA polymerase subunit alpha [Gemmatimonadota bacterium]MYH19636.1 DNA-directed RNA polymerase subunit alpha [Gemmatimonadota bacterium]MYK98779.1 DNA-directed RNA polymerase subunit alpha [Gemmatimonadota bacterium]
MKLKNFQMPRGVLVEDETVTDGYTKFVIEPLERGFGTTIGNSIRRVLLSSLPGAAVVGVRIDGVAHEFSTMPAVVEDVAEIILNLKELRLILHSEEPKTLMLEAEGKGDVTAEDIQTDADVEILNPDLHVASLDEGGQLRMEIHVDSGRGYVIAEQNKIPDQPIGVIPMDAMFSPVTRVNFQVENTRIGQRTDYDRLVLEIWTDASVGPQDALSTASQILRNHLQLFISIDDQFISEPEEEVDEKAEEIKKLLQMNVEELELSVRSSNCLRAADIKTLADLVQKSETEMLKYRNFGRKSLTELSQILQEMELGFGMDIEEYVEVEAENT